MRGMHPAGVLDRPQVGPQRGKGGVLRLGLVAHVQLAYLLLAMQGEVDIAEGAVEVFPKAKGLSGDVVSGVAVAVGRVRN